MFSRDLLCKVGNLLWLSHLWAWGGLLCHSKNIILHHLPKRARTAARGNQICKVCFREPTFAIVKTFYDCPLWVQVATEQQQVSFRIYPVCTTTHTKRASKIAAGGGHICELYPNSCKLENLLWLSPLSPSSSWATTGGFVASFSSAMVGCSPLPHPVSLRRIIVSGLNAEKNKAFFLTNSKPLRGSQSTSQQRAAHCALVQFRILVLFSE